MKAVTRNILLVSACLFMAGIVVFGIGFALGGRPGVEVSSKGIRSGSQKVIPYRLVKTQVDNFSNTNISIHSTADISVLPSEDDHYYLEYLLDGSYDKPGYTVNDHTLTLEQKSGSSFGFIGFFNIDMAQNNFVKLYVPKGKSIDSFKLYSDAGDLSFDRLIAASAKITADYGDVTMKNSQLGSLDLTLESGDLKLTDTRAKSFTLNNDYGDTTLKDLSCDSSKIKLANGGLYLAAAVPCNLVVNNEYGDTTLLLPDRIDNYQFNLSADYGDINIPQGAQEGAYSKDDGDSKHYKTKTGKYHIRVSSDDGDITIKNR